MKKCLISLDIKEMNIKRTLRHLTPVRMAIMKKIKNYGKDMGGREGTLKQCWWNVNESTHYGNQCGDSSKN
jgi:hypothetical protein